MHLELEKLIEQHRSIRKFQDRSVDPEIIKKAVELGIKSSSSGNMQSWSVVASFSPETKKALHQIHYQQQMILTSACTLTFCADFRRMTDWLQLRGAPTSFDDLSGFLVGAFDAIIASQTMALYLESQGLGICYMGTTLWESKKISDLLELPDLVIPVTSMVVGYPDEAPAARDRLPVNGILHMEKYQKPTPEMLNKIYAEREDKGWQRVLSFTTPEKQAQMKALGITNLAQFYTSEFKYSKEFFAEKAHEFLQELKRKGYWNF